MQNVRGRVGVLGRRHMRVRFNMDANAESTIQAQKQPESPARDELLKRLIGRINRRERELSTCLQPSTDTAKVLKDSLAATRVKHEETVLNELKYAIDRITSNEYEANYYKKKIIRELENWIARNEAELEEIKTIGAEMEGRCAKLLAEIEHLAQIASNLRWLSSSCCRRVTKMTTPHGSATNDAYDSPISATQNCSTTRCSVPSKGTFSSATALNLSDSTTPTSDVSDT
uniref:Not3 domain-containing protein n=1 Tax=Ascaris lumbricoides TaxID=6252 RepID=A0A0M3IDZ4_ASCLU